MNDKTPTQSILKNIIHWLYCPLKPISRSSLKRKRYFIINLVIASLVVGGLAWMEDSIFFKEQKDRVLDWVMYWHSDFSVVLANQQEMQRMMLVEIDETTFREWGSPVITPRDKLKEIIAKAEQAGASVIAVDLELSWWSDGCIHEVGKTPACSLADSTADDSLAQYLHSLNERQTPKAPIIILTRTYRYPLGKTQAFRERAPSFLDDTLKSQKNVFWSSTFFKVDDDRIRRRWQLASLICQDEHLTLMPSMQLLVAMTQLYTTPDSTREAAQLIRTKLKQWNDWANTLSCDANQGSTLAQLCQRQQSCPDLTVELPKQAGLSDETHLVDLAGGRETERVVYRFAPPDNPNPFQRRLIDKINAQQLLSHDIDNQIVLIGVTYPESGDHHPIPIRDKEVDGVYIVANAIDTLLRFGQFQPQPWLNQWLISLAIIIIATIIFSLYGIIRAFAYSTIIVGVALFVLSGQALHHGIGVDIALPLLAIQIVQMILYIFETLYEGGKSC